MIDEELQERLWLADEIYTDGGVIGFKEANLGGTWAFVVVSHALASVGPDGYEITHRNGFVPRTSFGPVTNNHTEQMAIVKAMEFMPEGWSGKIVSDSDVALGRVFGYYRSTNNLPSCIIRRTERAKARLGNLTFELVKGCKSDKHEKAGFVETHLGKLRYSKWNRLADKLCNEAKNLCVRQVVGVIE